MTKILFIVPPYVGYDSFVTPAFNDGIRPKETGNYRNLVADMPLGILSLSAYLKANADVEVKLIDFNLILNALQRFEYRSFSDLFCKELSSVIGADFVPDIVSISTLFTPSYYNMLDVAEVSRELLPKALIVAGGGVPTNMYREIFRDSTCFDALCYGEGERPMLGLVKAQDRATYLQRAPAWVTRDKVERGVEFQHDCIRNLDEIPFFDYDLVNMDEYRMSPILATFPLAKEKMNSIPVMTSRGCTHRCCFCASHSVHGREMRYQSVGRVEEDFRRLKDKYGATSIVFFDDHLMADRKRVFEIVDILKELKLTAFFPNSLALYALDRKVLEALKSVGLNELVLSVESGSDKVLREIMHKPLDLRIVKRVIADCRDLGIAADVAILIGLPGETKQDIENTRSFLRTLDATWFRINVATPLVGSELLETCVKKNYLKGDYIGCEFKRAVIETEDFTAEFVQKKAYELNLELNFVHNSDFRMGNYEDALKGFENTLRVKSDHALALYYAAKCCRELGRQQRYEEYRKRYGDSISASEFWRSAISQFNLAPLG